MPKFYVVKDNKITNSIVAPSKHSAEKLTQAECLEITDTLQCGFGWTFDGNNWIPPVIEERSESL